MRFLRHVTLCVVGLGKLGAPLAAVLAAAGYQVSGVDNSGPVVAALGRGGQHVAVITSTVMPGSVESAA